MHPKICNIPSNYDGIIKRCISTLNKFSISDNNVNESKIVPYDSESSDYSGNITKILSKNQYKIRTICSKPSQKTTISVDRKWLETFPPIWDDGLMKDYAECIVEDYFVAASSRKDKKKIPSNKDEAISARQEEFFDDAQATWEPVQKEEKICTKTEKSNIPDKSLTQKSHKKSTSKVSKVKIVTPSARKQKTPSARKQKEKQHTQETTTKPPKKPLQSPYRRFTSTTNIVDFAAEHPNLVLKFPAVDTFFPRRCKKIVIDSARSLTKKKDRKSKESILKEQKRKEEHKEKEAEVHEYKEDNFDTIADNNKDEKIPHRQKSTIQFEDLAELTKEVDDTWHNMLSKNKPKGSGKVLHYTPKEYDDVLPIQKDPPKQFDVIYDSVRCAKSVDRFSATNLIMQTMPILSIRGDCKVQKAVKISIDSKSDGNVDIDETENVHYFEYTHRSVKDKKRILEEAENAIIDWENVTGNINITSRRPDVLVSQSSHGISVPNTGNRYLSPFAQEISVEESKPSGTSSAKKERKQAKLLKSSSMLEDSSTSQTDEEKIKKRQRIQNFSTSTSSYEINPTTSEDHKSNSDSSPRPEIVSSAEAELTVDGNQLANLTDVENILEEVFAQSPRKDHDQDHIKRAKDKKVASVSVDCHKLKFVIDSEAQTERPVKETTKKLPVSSSKATVAVDLFPSSPLLEARKSTKRIRKEVLKDVTEGLQKFKNIHTSTFDLVQTEACGIQGPSDYPNVKEVANKDGKQESSPSKGNRVDQLQSSEFQIPQKQQQLSSKPEQQQEQEQQSPLYEQKPKQQHQEIQVELRSDRSVKRKQIDIQSILDDSVEASHDYDVRNFVHEEQEATCSRFQYNFSGSSESYSIFNDHQVSCKPHCCWNIPCDRVFGSLADSLLLSNSSSLDSASNSPKHNSNKILKESGLDKNPKFARTLNKIYSDASKVTLKSPKHADPEVQRAVKKFLSSLTASQSTEMKRQNLIKKRIGLIPQQTSTSSGSEPFLKFKFRPSLESKTNIVDQRPLLSLSGTTSTEVHGNRTYQISPRDKLNSSESFPLTKGSEQFESSSFHFNSGEYLSSLSEGEVLSLGEVKNSNS